MVSAAALVPLAAPTGRTLAAPIFVAKPCAPRVAAARVTCGTVAVLENPEKPAGRTIPLNVVIVKPVKRAAGAIPKFHLEGGPGVAGTAPSPFYVGPGTIYGASRDVVLIDQRGTGGSGPLTCADLDRRNVWDDEYHPDQVEACRDALEAHADLTQYSTEHAAADVDAVRASLGYERIDIWSVSYGTELAQAYLKAHPERVHAAVLAGFVPLDVRQPLFHANNAQRVLDLLFYECAADATCRLKYPRLREDWASVLRRLDAGPVSVTVNGRSVRLRRGPFGELVRERMATASSQRALPALIHAAAGGDFIGFVGSNADGPPPVAEGLYLSIVCSEAQPRIPADVTALTSGTFLGSYRVVQERAACAHWVHHPIRDSFNLPPRDSVPVLVLTGSMDYVATPDWGWQFCRVRNNCRFVSIPEMSHGPYDLDRWTEGACFDQIASSFLTNPAAQVNTSCVARMRPPAFK